MNDLKLSAVLRRLYAEYGDAAPNYRKLYTGMLEGRVLGGVPLDVEIGASALPALSR